jgi:hypothetical protein
VFTILTLVFLSWTTSGTNAQSGSRCPAYPSFPDASCTGTLPNVARSSSGPITTSRNGQVIENLNISGYIIVAHSNVVIRNVKITNPGGTAVSNAECGANCNYVLEDCELDGRGNTTGASAVDFMNYTMRRCNIHGFGEGPGAVYDTVIEDNYMHDFGNFISTGAHQDGIQIEWGNNNVIRHNTIFMNVDGGNAAIVIGNQSGNRDNLVEQNLVSGGGFAVYVGGVATLRNNRFSTAIWPNSGYWGPVNQSSSNVSRCGNRWQTGQTAGNLLDGESACAGTPTTPPAPAAPTSVRIIR